MKSFLLIAFLFMTVPCHRPVVEVLHATSARQLPGRPETPVTVGYEVLVKAERSSDILAFDEIYSYGRPLGVEVLSWPGKERTNTFVAGDTLLLRASRQEKEKTTGDDGKSNLPPSLRDKELVIGYRIRKKERYLAVEEILRLPDKIRL